MTKQYIELGNKIIAEGQWQHNERTGKRCRVVINHDFEYNVGAGEFPLCTTRKSFWKAAVAELLGYIRGYDNAEDFNAIGSPTWNANANDNDAWLNNPNRIGHGDMGRVYGVQGRGWVAHDGAQIDQLRNIIEDLSNGIDNRGEILTYWNPGEFDLGCLRPCMHSFQFSLLNGTLYMHATQRSCDVPLGLNFNMVQVYTFLALMAQITGNKPGIAYHKIVNAHVYEDQYELFHEQCGRDPMPHATFHISPELKSLDDLMSENLVLEENFKVCNYNHHDPIKYPFSV